MKAKLARWILRILGFKLDMPPKPWPAQYVMPVIPHTSNWDFPLGLLVRVAMEENIIYAGKSSLFRWPYGGLFRWLGGYPVDRSKRTNFVDAVVDIFAEQEEFKLCIAPEGTRSKVEKLKTGFYYIAKGAGVPLMLCAFDYGKGCIRVDKPYFTTDDMEADFAYIYAFFGGVKGKNPEKSFSPSSP